MTTTTTDMEETAGKVAGNRFDRDLLSTVCSSPLLFVCAALDRHLHPGAEQLVKAASPVCNAGKGWTQLGHTFKL